VIGAAVLVTGLLLILAGLTAARIPGGAPFARPGIAGVPGDGDLPSGVFAFARRGPNPIRAFLLSPIHPATWDANVAIGAGLFVGILAFALVATLASAGLTTLLAGIGVVLLVAAIEGSRRIAQIERRRAFIGEASRPAAHAYRPLRGSIVDLLRAEFMDESRWRDVLYVAINLPLTIIEFVVAVVLWTLALAMLTTPVWYDATGAELGVLGSHDPLVIALRVGFGFLLLAAAASVSQLLIALHRGGVAGLLCTSESRELRRQVEELRQSRSAVLDVEASELQRIERDLHDGAQQRLVMLTIDTGLASERIDTDPEAAKRLILDAQEQAREALADIRRLVRGIAPSILLDRGLVAALESLTGRGSVPTTVRSGLSPGERFSPAAERAAYFVATEALANVAKHSGATRCEVRVRRSGGQLVVEIEDDGRGGAATTPGGGLEGLAGRVAGVDGTFEVSSPPGGPTIVRASIPAAAASADPASRDPADPTPAS
jgi:signal transduction histidine kinase